MAGIELCGCDLAVHGHWIGNRGMSNPYHIEGPALISFSGGRTSGYMLWHILDAFDGKLPDDIHVCFANTGKEREETLRFVHECESRWGVRVRWLEFVTDLKTPPPSERFAEVGYNSASRNGEPFERLIVRKQRGPNSLMRFCTERLKVQCMTDFAASIGWAEGSYIEVVGLRADEMMRVFRLIERNAERGRDVRAPLAKAGVRKADVNAFWQRQRFDLGIKPGEGNCDLCFLKGRANLVRLIRKNPASADWWINIEEGIGKGTFRQEYSYRQLRDEAFASPLLPLSDDDDEFDAECGLWCAGEEAA
jgi:3'-phosphoadenosine 5'-phosphosulfate sulfotransferase (PAPS reductase)/FAD synthetase